MSRLIPAPTRMIFNSGLVSAGLLLAYRQKKKPKGINPATLMARSSRYPKFGRNSSQGRSKRIWWGRVKYLGMSKEDFTRHLILDSVACAFVEQEKRHRLFALLDSWAAILRPGLKMSQDLRSGESSTVQSESIKFPDQPEL